MPSLKFDIHTPLTSAAIQQARRVYIAKHKMYVLLLALLVLGIVISFAGAFVFGGVFNFFGHILGLLLLVSLFVVASLADSLPNVDNVHGSDCAQLLEACMATPEGQKYRAAVLAQGRNFLVIEAKMIYAWTKEFESQTACKKLYDIQA